MSSATIIDGADAPHSSTGRGRDPNPSPTLGSPEPFDLEQELFVEESRDGTQRLKLDDKSNAVTLSASCGEKAAKILRRWDNVRRRGEEIYESDGDYAADTFQLVALRVHKAMHVYAIEYCRPKLKGMMAKMYQEPAIRKALLDANVQVSLLQDMKQRKSQAVADLEARIRSIRDTLQDVESGPPSTGLGLKEAPRLLGSRRSESPVPKGPGTVAMDPKEFNSKFPVANKERTCKKGCSIM
jgi:hypothetical protein